MECPIVLYAMGSVKNNIESQKLRDPNLRYGMEVMLSQLWVTAKAVPSCQNW